MLKLQLCKVKTMPRSPFKTENPWKGYSGVISRVCPTFLCHVWGRKTVGAVTTETKQDQTAQCVHLSDLLQSTWLQMPSPSVWTQGWCTPFMVLLRVDPLLLISPAKIQESQSVSNQQPTSCSRSRWCPCRGAQYCIHMKQKFVNGIQWTYYFINFKLTSPVPSAAVLKGAGTPIQDGSSTSEEP